MLAENAPITLADTNPATALNVIGGPNNPATIAKIRDNLFVITGRTKLDVINLQEKLDQQLQHRDHDQQADQAPGEPGGRAAPEVARALPEPAERVAGRDEQQAGVKHRRRPARGA